jgi:hypothetical protein
MMESSLRLWAAHDYGSSLDQTEAALSLAQLEGLHHKLWGWGLSLLAFMGSVIGTSVPLLSWTGSLLISWELWLGSTESKTIRGFLIREINQSESLVLRTLTHHLEF